jgi:integrase
MPWNKGKLTGAKPPLRPKHVWSIRTKLQIEGRIRDLAMFNLAIDSKLRGCDVVATRVEDVAAGGYTADRATVRQKKTGRPVRFELSEQTRQAVDDDLKAANKRPVEFLFTGRRGPNRNMTTRQFARLVSEWIGSVGLDPRLFGTHSLRRTKATLNRELLTGHDQKLNFRVSAIVQTHSDNGMTLNSVQYLYCSALECSFTQRRRKASGILFLNATPRDQRTDANYSRLARFHVGAISLQRQFCGSEIERG